VILKQKCFAKYKALYKCRMKLHRSESVLLVQGTLKCASLILNDPRLQAKTTQSLQYSQQGRPLATSPPYSEQSHYFNYLVYKAPE